MIYQDNWAASAATPGSRGVLSLTVAEGPILLLDLNQVDEHIFALETQAFMQAVNHGLIEGALHIHRPPLTERHLDDDGLRRALNTHVRGIDDKAAARVFGNDLETIVLWDIQNTEHGAVDNLADSAAIVRGLAGRNIKAHHEEWGT